MTRLVTMTEIVPSSTAILVDFDDEGVEGKLAMGGERLHLSG